MAEARHGGGDENEQKIRDLLIYQKTMVAQDEQNMQAIFDLKRKLSVKESLEKDMVREIANLTDNLEKLQEQAAKKNVDYLAIKQSLDRAKEEIADLKSAEENIASPAQSRPVMVQVEAPPEPTVTLDEYVAIKMELEASQAGFNAAVLREIELESANKTLLEDRASLQAEVGKLAAECQAAKQSYDDINALLDEYKMQLAEAHEELTALSEQPLKPDSRGNSLFAEVEDKRKEVTQRFAALKSKYLALNAKLKNSTFQPTTLAAERASLLRMIEDINATNEIVVDGEVESLRQRIRVQDEVIEKLTKNKEEIQPNVFDAVRAAEMQYIDKVMADVKRNERNLIIQRDSCSKDKLLLQEKVLALQANLAASNKKLVSTLVKKRIADIDGIPEDESDDSDFPLGSGLWPVVFEPVSTAYNQQAPNEKLVSTLVKKPIADLNVIAEDESNESDFPLASEPSPPRVALKYLSKARDQQARTVPSGKASDGYAVQSDAKPSGLSAGQSTHKRLPGTDVHNTEPKRKTVRFTEENPLDIPGQSKPQESSDEDLDVVLKTDKPRPAFRRVYIPQAKRQKNGEGGSKPKSEDK